MTTILSQSLQYLNVQVTGTLPNGTVVDPSSDVVEFAFLAGVQEPDATTTWTAGSWASGANGTYVAQILVGSGGSVSLTPGTWNVYVRVHATPELPVLPAGSLTID